MALTLRVGIRIRAPREFVFQHLLTPHHLARWFCNFAQFDPRGPAVGTKFRFGGDYAIASADPPGWPCEIAGGEVLRAVAFTWPLFGADTRVDWRVEDAPDGSVLRTVHAGLPREESTCGRFHDAWRICLGNLKAVAEARDDSLRPDSSPVHGGAIRLNVLIDAPPSKVFGALVEPGILAQWTEEPSPVVEPRVGGRYGIHGPSGAPASILEIESGKRLALSWPVADAPTQVSFSLEDKGGKRTGLYFLQEGVPAGGALLLRCRWSDLLVGLKNLLEAGGTGFAEPYGAQPQTG
jgi:uncharacterized protein YndB with AHSA1/START domain